MESINEPQVVQNCDTLYKSDIVWDNDTTVREKTEYEINMLKDTKTPEELLKEERKEECVKQVEEDQKEKLKSLLIMFKVITAHRLGYHPLINLSTLQPLQAERFKNNMESLVEDYNNDMGKEIAEEFNRICNEKLFNPGADMTSYPVYQH
jgi:hypothetical protein